MATMKGESDIALANVVGSNSFNIGFILGITALLFPISVNPKMVKFDSLVMALVSVLSLIVLFFAHLNWVVGIGLLMALVEHP